jgi:hypothetical protein
MTYVELNTPRLTGNFEQMLRGISGVPNSDKRGSGFMILMSIKNLGTPSIADGFMLDVWTNKDTTPLEARPNVWQQNTNHQMELRVQDSGEKFDFEPSEMIFEKTSSPITQGEKVHGWISFDFPDTNLFYANLNNMKFVVSFSDVTGSRIFVTNDAFSQYEGKLHYLPGSKYPEQP